MIARKRYVYLISSILSSRNRVLSLLGDFVLPVVGRGLTRAEEHGPFRNRGIDKHRWRKDSNVWNI